LVDYPCAEAPLGESASPEGLIASFRTRVVAEPTLRARASADLKAVFSEISEQVRLLDGLVRYRFGDNEELMGAWASARSVFGPKSSPASEGPEVVKLAA
jgi:hypothetical protein